MHLPTILLGFEDQFNVQIDVGMHIFALPIGSGDHYLENLVHK